MIISIDNALLIHDVLYKIGEQDIHGKLAFLCYRNVSKLSATIDDFNRQKDVLVRKYGEQFDGRFSIAVNSENYDKFLEQINPILAHTEEIDLYQLSQEEFEALSDANLSVKDYAVLDRWLVKHPSKGSKE